VFNLGYYRGGFVGSALVQIMLQKSFCLNDHNFLGLSSYERFRCYGTYQREAIPLFPFEEVPQGL
jgi:hypothetical protein